MSNLQLQKLVYYAQAWHLGIHQSPLFEEDFQAWIHGPVIPALYQKYEEYSWKPILAPAESSLPKETVDFLQEVIDEYLACNAYELELMTQQEEPWKRARIGLQKDEACETVIEKEWMKAYYSSRAEET